MNIQNSDNIQGNNGEYRSGNTVRPRTGTGAGSVTAQESEPDAGIPFIKSEDGKIGWDMIRAEEEKAEEGSNAAKPAQPEETDRAAGNETAEAESPQAGQPWWFVVTGILVIMTGTGVFFAVRKKRDTR